MENVEKLLMQLLKIPSESKGEKQVSKYLLSLLSRNFGVKKIPVSQGRFNVFAVSGRPETVLVAHMDTVAGQLRIKFDSQSIYGRGACDNKNSVAAMIESASQAQRQGVTNFGILLTVGEETTFDGAMAAQAYFKKNHIKPNLVVIGEPTEGRIVTAQKGVFCFDIIAQGIKGHGSNSNNSAIHNLVTSMTAILKMNSPKNIVNIGVITGGEALNIVASEARASVVVRSSTTDIKERVFKVLKSKKVTIKILKDIPPVKSSLVKSGPQTEVNFFTEMAFFDNSLVLGSGSIKNAHGNHEFVSRKNLVAIVGRYNNILKTGKIT